MAKRTRKFGDGGVVDIVDRDMAASEGGRTNRNFRKLSKAGVGLDIDGDLSTVGTGKGKSPEQRKKMKETGKKLRDMAWDEAESYDGAIHSKGREYSAKYKKGGLVKAKAKKPASKKKR